MTRCLSVIPNEDALRLRRLAMDGESEICIERRRDGDIVFVMVNQAVDGRFRILQERDKLQTRHCLVLSVEASNLRRWSGATVGPCDRGVFLSTHATLTMVLSMGAHC
jgi:hypothetical protein